MHCSDAFSALVVFSLPVVVILAAGIFVAVRRLFWRGDTGTICRTCLFCPLTSLEEHYEKYLFAAALVTAVAAPAFADEVGVHAARLVRV